MKKLLVAFIATVMILSLAGCGNQTSTGATEPSNNESGEVTLKKDVVIGIDSPNLTMDVQEITNTHDFAAHKLCHENLFKYNDNTKAFDLWLCESYEMDGSVWTLHLRKGVKFHNGTEFSAEDVYYTLITRGQVSAQTSSFCKDLSAEIIDRYTIKIDTGSVNMDFIPRMAYPTYAMICKEACEADPDHGFEIGTGPYVFDELFENSFLRFVKNENYWGKEPTCDSIEFRYYAEPSARLIALQNGEIDVCIAPASTELEYVRKDENLELIEAVGAHSVYITFNTEKEPYNNIEFRQAVAYAIDDQAVIDIVVDGLGTISKSTFGPNSAVYCQDELKGYEYNPAKAKELIEKNGWKGKTITILCNDKAIDSKSSVTVQSMLNAVGLDCKIEQRGVAEVVAARAAGEHDMMIGQFGSSDYPDGVKINCSSTGSYNFARFSDPEIDAMLDEALTIEDWDTRKALYTKVQQIVFDDMCYYYPIFRENANYAIAKGVTGFTPKSNFQVDYSYIQVPKR